MKYLFQFGEEVKGYSVKVINEREARGAAGIFFALAFFSFLYAISSHDFRYTQIFVTLFFVDFFIRVIINPRYAPSMVLARFAVRGMKPEYVGAPQKHFAWSIGLVLATFMTYFIWEGVMLPEVKIPICILCLFLFFFETAFGIYIGCKIYNLIVVVTYFTYQATIELNTKSPSSYISTSKCGADKCSSGKCGAD